jgi:hypothetical protein
MGKQSSKKKARHPRLGESVYCGNRGQVTGDHVPPRTFYGKIPPKNLITVPACRPCNAGFSKNDDYVRLVLTTTEGRTDNETRNELIEVVKRFAERLESKNILSGFYESLESAYVLNEFGILVRRQKFMVEGARMDAFGVRVAKALFFRVKGHRLPDGYIVNSIHFRRFPQIEAMSVENRDFWPMIISELLHSSQKEVWGDVFSYSWVQSPNNPDATWWLLSLYGKTQYLCSTWNAALAEKWPRG